MNTHTVSGEASLLDTVASALVSAGQAIATTTRKVIRAAHAVITVTRRHVPAWVAALLTICLAIPGPVDELIVLVFIAGFAAFKPQMRADFARTVPNAWKGME